MPDPQECIDALVELQGGSSIEDLLLRSAITSCEQLSRRQSGQNATYRLFFDEEPAYFKPLNGVNLTPASMMEHDQASVTIAEAAAWRLAHLLGPPLDEIVTPCVLRWVDEVDRDAPGALTEARYGEGQKSVFFEGPRFCIAAAFFDALIGNQDRGGGNFKWNSQAERLSLFDHGYALPSTTEPFIKELFLEWRWRAGLEGLHPWEHAALEKLLGDGELLGMTSCLDHARAEALRQRAEQMASDRQLRPVYAS